MKFLVLGAGGMAGHVIAIYLKKNGHDVTGLVRRPIDYVPYIIGDVYQTEELRTIITKNKYDVVINAIGILNQAVDTQLSEGIFINSYLPHALVEMTKATATKIIHLSTDCVFSGQVGNYTETSYTDAESFYGRTKALGEIVDNKNLTLRTSIIGPDRNKDGIGLFHWFMTQKDMVYGYQKAIWTGVTTLVLARAIEAATMQNITGLYHLVNNKSINKYELLRLFNSLKEEPTMILENDTVCINKSLVNNRNDFDFHIPPYLEMVEEMGKWIKEHSNLYPWYESI